MSWERNTDESSQSAEKSAATEGFDYRSFMASHASATVLNYPSGNMVYAQGDPANALYYIIDGTVKVTIVSKSGKEGVIAFLGTRSFFGKDCLYSQHRVATMTAMRTCTFARITKELVTRALEEDQHFAKSLVGYTLGENAKLREELTDHLFNSSEKRLARILLTLANAASGERSNAIPVPVTQETLAQMVGTTRARINHFMTKFRRLGYVEYDGKIRVHESLTEFVTSSERHNLEC